MQQPGSMMDRPLLVSAILEHGAVSYTHLRAHET